MLNAPPTHLLAAIVDSSNDAIVSKTLDGTITSWNRAAERLFGYTAVEAIGRPITMLFPPNRMAEEELFIREIAVGRRVEHFETERVCKDGQLVSVAVTLSPIIGNNGRIAGVSTIFRDVTARRRDKEALTTARHAADAQAERLKLALAAARLGDWELDVTTHVVTMSQRAAEIFEIPAGPYMTWTAMRQLLHPDDRERARLAVERSIAEHGDYSVEYRLVNGNRERLVSASGRAQYNELGDVVSMFGVVQDVTRDRLLTRVDDAVRLLSDPEAITATVAEVLGQHLRVNRCAYATVDDDADSFVLTGNYTNGVPSSVGTYAFSQFGAECLRLMRAGEPWVVADCDADPRLDAADCVVYHATAIRALICVPILKSDRLVAAMAVHMSTPRKWYGKEIELVQQVASRSWESIERARIERDRAELLEAAESANRAKDEFMAMLGHELRNPLSPILTALQLMKLRGNAPSEYERAVIERQVSHLTRLVDDLLDVSRIARGKVELKVGFIELAEAVSQAIETASPLLEERMHQLTVTMPRSGLLLQADTARLAQIVSNLLTNAAKYTPNGGQITVSAAAEANDVVLRVRDDGIGIAPEMLPQVWERFVQGGQQSDRPEGGLGLGLTIVKSLVERHGGSVSAHSAGRGHGSEFVVRLPRATRAIEGRDDSFEASLEPVRTDQDQVRILVVDDNEDAANMVAAALKFKGYQTRIAYDGLAALNTAMSFRPHVAVLDLGLPVLDGYELAARLRELPGMECVSLIAVTGYGQPSDRQRTKAAGFAHHVVKPVDLDTLDSILNSVASGLR